eukprot:EG_transcript_22050
METDSCLGGDILSNYKKAIVQKTDEKRGLGNEALGNVALGNEAPAGKKAHQTPTHFRPAPPLRPIARQYWRLPETAMFVDVLRHVGADETHHRDVNHTFASMDLQETNPFVLTHLHDAADAWRSETKGGLVLTRIELDGADC